MAMSGRGEGPDCKILVLGDGCAGKTCLLITYIYNEFPSEYVPTSIETHQHNIIVDDQPVAIAFWDTAGGEDYDRLRPLSYPNTDVFLVCFDISNSASFSNITDKWVPELEHFCPDIPKVLVGCKSDLHRDEPQIVTSAEAVELGKRFGMEYYETSAMKHLGLKSCIENSVRIALRAQSSRLTVSKGSRLGRLFSKAKRKAKDGRQPPVMPPAGKAPWLEVETSTYADQWRALLEDPKHADVTFIVEDKHHVKAHKIVLASSSEFFRWAFGIKSNAKENPLETLMDEGVFSREVHGGRVRGISKVYEEDIPQTKSTQSMMYIHLSDAISGNTFAQVLRFLYTGVPHFKGDVGEEELNLLIEASHIFKLNQLEIICNNQKTDNSFLNPSIGTYLNDENGQMMKNIFFNKPDMADIAFKIQGEKIWAHKAVLTAHCDVMAAMFSGNFTEGTSTSEIEICEFTYECFLALLEYLYTDHAPIEDSDSVDIMVLANQYCQPRLVNLCEICITKDVERSCAKNIEKSDNDIIGLLHMSQLHNAEQLANWCLHFISTNYQAFIKRSEFEQLKGANLEYVEEHQWPPLDYLEAVKTYEDMKAKGEKCVVM